MLRREYKYLVPVKYLDELRNDLLPFIELDKYSDIRPNKEYTIRSIYYDNTAMDYYQEKVDGVKMRKKIRIRGYNEFSDKNIVFLEIKRKLENFIDKNRAQLFYENLDDLFFTGDVESYVIRKEPTSVQDAKRFFFHIHRNTLRPVSLVVYDREAFFSKFDSNIRITFDKNLRYAPFPTFGDLYEENILRKVMINYFVLELKFYKGFSENYQRLINKYGLVRQAVSKYQICVDAEMSRQCTTNFRQFIFSNPALQQQIFRKEAV